MAGLMDIQSLHRLTSHRETQLKKIIRERATDLEEIDHLRRLIRDAYVKMIFDDPDYATSKEMEQSLWKTCFYRKIEEFRKRIRRFASSAASAENKPLAVKARNDLHGVCVEFSTFLSEALTFYQELMGRFELLQSAQFEEKAKHGANLMATLDHYCMRSIHRCLIFLGDLARYKELHSESTRKDWSQAERWYYQAIDVFPTSGNPHNQLAVLATYTEAECVAVYRYCRALLCDLPFPTAKENLSLLFEKNKQSMPEAEGLEAQQYADEEDRMRQGLMSGLITGQQAGIARATMLKSLLQRFVRLHGILFAYNYADNAKDGSGPFPVKEFLSILSVAMLDLRQLLRMSAFGDGLLLHMVVICIFSVLSSAPGVGDSDPDQDNPPQCAALSLAFGVVSEIAQCVRTIRQDSEHTTAKPPGSRLLGPVVVFCDWLASRPDLWRLKPVKRGALKGPSVAEKEKEGALREQFWLSLCKIATDLQVQLQPYPHIPSALVWSRQDGRVLKEQHDLRGLQPLHEVYGVELMSKAKAELGRLEIVSDDIAAFWRTVRLAKFLREVGGAAELVAWGKNPLDSNCLVFTASGREAATSGALSTPFGSLTQNGKLENGDEGDEVIVFQPAFSAVGHAESSQNKPALDDSSQLPKDVLESMIGGLLDCSDSGPHPRVQSQQQQQQQQPPPQAQTLFPNDQRSWQPGTISHPSRPTSAASTIGWSAFSGNNSPTLSPYYPSSGSLRPGQPSTSSPLMTPPPGFDFAAPRSSLADASMFSAELGRAASNPYELPSVSGAGTQMYSPFGPMRNPVYSRVVETSTGRHSAPPGIPLNHLATKNPFLTGQEGLSFS